MIKPKNLALPLLLGSLVLSCKKTEQTEAPEAKAEVAPVFPASDPENTDGWVFNEIMSDEFEGDALDDKWFVQGTAGGFHKWKGRAPSQFAPHNVLVQDGKLIIRSQWEPDYDFSKEKFSGLDYENITTAGVISHNKFLYGYMEIKSKAADAAMTSSFWTLGYQSELDMFEQMGAPSLEQKKGFEKGYMFSIHDWRPGIVKGENKIFTKTHQLPYRVADDFHVYGCEWGADYLKVFADGEEVFSTTQKELGDAWILTNPLELWFDSETFPWMGLPKAEDLPADFEVEYVRVWQKPTPNLLDRTFYGFEGPIVLDEVRLPAPEQPFQKEWFFSGNPPHNFSIASDKYSLGRKSLKFSNDGPLADDSAAAMSPYGSVILSAGDYTLSMKLWIEPGSAVKKLHPILEEPWLQVTPIDLSKVKQGEWVTVTQNFTRAESSAAKDRFRLVVNKADVTEGKSTMFIDEVSIEVVKK